MPVLNEQNHVGEFIVSEANGYRSRVEANVSDDFDGRTTYSGTVVEYSDVVSQYQDIVDGATGPVAVLYSQVNEADSVGNPGAVFIARDAEVARARLTYPAGFTPAQIAAAEVRLLAVGIKVV